MVAPGHDHVALAIIAFRAPSVKEPSRVHVSAPATAAAKLAG
jgi:hypothetical protein